jgi:hypothetical protein
MFSYGLSPVSVFGGSIAIDGASAYQIAIANGFVGTEVQWLASLTGTQGPAGATGPEGPAGPRGVQGERGVAGPQGLQGVAGPTGAPGSRGDTGPAGPRGLQGETGATGATGPAGPAGPQGVAGPTGLTGATGAAGPRGERGERGETGQRGDHFVTSSVTPLAISSGSVALDVEVGLSYTPGQHVIISNSVDRFMLGYVASYNDGTGELSVDVYQTAGSGSYVEWYVNLESRGTPGDSAYQIALNNGFAGPESAWLESLVGEQGPPGLSGVGAYHHVQESSSMVWQVSHNLGFNPSVTIHDEDENVIIGAIDYIDENTLNLLFNAAIAGNAHLS